ncbi:MAG: ATP-binding cassette domain-containing protein [Clostridia bacterium]|nr:ATP-binding cassette domain-containing protein [Clostridia bacterium]
MIEVKNLTKRYGNHEAVKNASFTINDGEVVGFLGPNGAGKSTTMNILTGYLSATSGTAKINGYDILENPIEAKRHIGYLPEQPPLYLDMTVEEYLDFVYYLKNTSLPKRPHLAEICQLVKIENVKKRLIRNLSKGYRQRVGIAQALIGNPDVLILDEPTVGLDPMQIIEIRNLITQLGRNHTVILSSHILSEIQAVCERIMIINQGYIIADGTAAELSETLSEDYTVVAQIIGPPREVKEALEGVKGVKNIKVMGLFGKATEYHIEPEMGVDIRRGIFERVVAKKWTLIDLTTRKMTLEDIFLKMTEESPERLNRIFEARKNGEEIPEFDEEGNEITKDDEIDSVEEIDEIIENKETTAEAEMPQELEDTLQFENEKVVVDLSDIESVEDEKTEESEVTE